MLVRTGRRVRLTAFVLALLAAGGAVAWAVSDSYRPREASELAAALQRLVLERNILREEFVLHGEERPRAQWREHTVRIQATLARCRARAGTEQEREVLGRLDDNVRESIELFRLVEEDVRGGGASRGLAGVRASEDLLLLSFELYEGASRLAAAAAAVERAEQRWSLSLVAGVVLAAIAGVIVVTVATGADLARRLARLEEGANRIAAGDLSSRIGMTGDDEVAGVARAFDAMAAKVAEGVRQLERSNQELQAFSVAVSHDLRAPLRHLTGFVELLAERVQGLDAEAQHCLDVIRQAAVRMGHLIDDLLALSRVAREPLAPRLVALGPLVDEVVAEAAATHAHAPEVRWEIGPLPVVAADPGLLRLVLANLVGNALKFSRTRPVAHVALGARFEGEEVQVFVRDDGVGFDPGHADHLFEVFKRLHRADEFEGNGIGLANVRRIVHRHGGRTWAEGRVGAGATFWFSLPRSGAPRA